MIRIANYRMGPTSAFSACRGLISHVRIAGEEWQKAPDFDDFDVGVALGVVALALAQQDASVVSFRQACMKARHRFGT
jgi:hypothetical protein